MLLASYALHHACRYLFFVFDCVYVKHVCENVKMSNWGRVFYTNFLTLPFLMVMIPVLDEPARLSSIVWQTQVGVSRNGWPSQTAWCTHTDTHTHTRACSRSPQVPKLSVVSRYL